MNEELKKSVISKVEELLDKPLMDAKIQIDYHRDEVPTIRYDITEVIRQAVNDLKEKEIIEKQGKRMKKHCVYFEGHIDFLTDSEDEEKILDEAYDLMFGNIPDIDVTIANMALDDDED